MGYVKKRGGRFRLDLDETDGGEWKSAGGAGFGHPTENKLVEDAAILFVTADYVRRDWDVKSREKDKCGFDLECVKGRKVENVEVKGVRGNEESFPITINEVKRARTDPQFFLAVVTSALSSPKLARYSGREFCQRFKLSPLGYWAVLES